MTGGRRAYVQAPWTVVSPRRWREFQVCPRRYHNRYVLNLPEDDQFGEPARLGLAVHEELHARHDRPGRHDDSGLVRDDLPPQPRLLEAVRRHLELCPASGRTDPTYVGGELERYWLLRRDRILVSGRLDALWRCADGTLEVHDYKTGSAPDGDAQRFAIQTYALLAATTLPRPPGVRVVIERLLGEHHGAAVTVADGPFLRAALEAVRHAGSVLAGKGFAATPSPVTCGRCSYRAICPAGVAPPVP